MSDKDDDDLFGGSPPPGGGGGYDAIERGYLNELARGALDRARAGPEWVPDE